MPSLLTRRRATSLAPSPIATTTRRSLKHADESAKVSRSRHAIGLADRSLVPEVVGHGVPPDAHLWIDTRAAESVSLTSGRGIPVDVGVGDPGLVRAALLGCARIAQDEQQTRSRERPLGIRRRHRTARVCGDPSHVIEERISQGSRRCYLASATWTGARSLRLEAHRPRREERGQDHRPSSVSRRSRREPSQPARGRLGGAAAA